MSLNTIGGIEENFVFKFNSRCLNNVRGVKDGSIKFTDHGYEIAADINVITVLKVLFETGNTKNRELAAACRKYVSAIMQSNRQYITKEIALKSVGQDEVVLSSDTNSYSITDRTYEENCLLAAITRCLGG